MTPPLPSPNGEGERALPFPLGKGLGVRLKLAHAGFEIKRMGFDKGFMGSRVANKVFVVV